MADPAALSVAQTRFLRAVSALAVDTASLQERLSAAWQELMPLTREDLPPQWHARFSAVAAELLAAPDDPGTLSDAVALAVSPQTGGRTVCWSRSLVHGGSGRRQQAGQAR